METIQITTVGNQRWDQIALEMYGKADLFEDIIRANPEVPITTHLPDGLALKIPVLDNVSVKLDSESLPPWKR